MSNPKGENPDVVKTEEVLTINGIADQFPHVLPDVDTLVERVSEGEMLRKDPTTLPQLIEDVRTGAITELTPMTDLDPGFGGTRTFTARVGKPAIKTAADVSTVTHGKF